MNNEHNKPILYSFRRCPYAIRARICLAYSQVDFELRNILLKDKPQELLNSSAKGTVPVLVLNNKVLDESIDIVKWSLSENDPENWLQANAEQTISSLITENDGIFKKLLDQYKYSDAAESLAARNQALKTLLSWEQRLNNTTFLVSSHISMADIALFPFVRQFAKIDTEWFEKQDVPRLQKWLNYFLESDMFKETMRKTPLWHP